jgi:hypothetical protein
MKDAHKNLIGKTYKESSLKIHRHRFKDSIKIVFLKKYFVSVQTEFNCLRIGSSVRLL